MRIKKKTAQDRGIRAANGLGHDGSRHAWGHPQWIPESIEWTTKSLNALALPYSDHPDFEPEWLAET